MNFDKLVQMLKTDESARGAASDMQASSAVVHAVDKYPEGKGKSMPYKPAFRKGKTVLLVSSTRALIVDALTHPGVRNVLHERLLATIAT